MIGWLKLEESLPALISACRDREAAVRRAAVSALGLLDERTRGQCGDRQRSTIPIGWCAKSRPRTLARTAGADAGKRLIAALADQYWQVTLKAVRSLGKLRVTLSR